MDHLPSIILSCVFSLGTAGLMARAGRLVQGLRARETEETKVLEASWEYSRARLHNKYFSFSPES